MFASVAIGGTNCSVAIAADVVDGFEWLGHRRFSTLASPDEVLSTLVRELEALLACVTDYELAGVGIVCGGPLDEGAGLVLSPPNLPRWDRIDVRAPFIESFNVPVQLMNDANAGVMAEWMWGAARGTTDAAFLTMGTGLGAGLIVDGRLHRGASGLAGEIGHWRLAVSGPHGYGKDGSFEGFCSGAGIGKWAQQTAASSLQHGRPSELAPDWFDLADVTAHQLAKAADGGDEVALRLWSDVGRKLGAGLSLLVDLLNPDIIVIGGIYVRQHDRLEPTMLEELRNEALPESLASCRIVPSELGEEIADYSGLVAALVGDESTSDGRDITAAIPVHRSAAAHTSVRGSFAEASSSHTATNQQKEE
ncbi:MAG: ROK family protein [Acidimicrobiales bacterium]